MHDLVAERASNRVEVPGFAATSLCKAADDLHRECRAGTLTSRP